MIILDLTWSMYAADISPSRLVTAKRKISDLLSARDEGMTALVSFAGDAHTAAMLPWPLPLCPHEGFPIFPFLGEYMKGSPLLPAFLGVSSSHNNRALEEKVREL